MSTSLPVYNPSDHPVHVQLLPMDLVQELTGDDTSILMTPSAFHLAPHATGLLSTLSFIFFLSLSLSV